MHNALSSGYSERVDEQSGIGVGLLLSKMLIHKLEGHIDFSTRYREGSVFFFTIDVE